MKINLVYDNISEFSTSHTIYMKINDTAGLFLCEFIKLDMGVVQGKVIKAFTNEQLYKNRIEDGWIIKAVVKNCALWGTTNNEQRGRYHWFDATGYAAYENIDRMRELMPKNHNSYGTISLSRSQSSGTNTLFGSSIKHSNTITLKISRATLNRELNRDWIHSSGTDEIVSVEMSESQFAQAITMFNRGEGTPVTLKYVNGERMHECPYVSKVEQFSREFAQDMKQIEHDLQMNLTKAMEILNSGKAPSKGEREIIIKAMEGLTKGISDKLPYVANSFNTQMEQTVTEAKKEIEQFMVTKAAELGLTNESKPPLSID